MSYDELIEVTLKQFNLPRIKFENSFKNEVLIPSIELLGEYKNAHDELDYDNILKIMMLILNRINERAVRKRTPKTITFASAIIWHSVINKNVAGKYIMQFPLKDMLNGNLSALRSLREDLDIKDRKYEDINEFREKLEAKPPLWLIIKEATLRLNGSSSIKNIKELIGKLYSGISEVDIEKAIYCTTVNNKKRFFCNYNLEPRVCNKEFDILFHLGDENFELYLPNKNGIWEILQDSSGNLKCNQKLNPEIYKALMEFIYNKKENIFVSATAIFLYFNTQKSYYSDNEIWRDFQIYLREVFDNIKLSSTGALIDTEILTRAV
ncbi:MAG: hypothetical protein ACFFDF_18490, partial [Candidatus Odinarchaeota archaeon]